MDRIPAPRDGSVETVRVFTTSRHRRVRRAADPTGPAAPAWPTAI